MIIDLGVIAETVLGNVLFQQAKGNAILVLGPLYCRYFSVKILGSYMWQLAGDGGLRLSAQAPRIVSYLAVQGSDFGLLANVRPLV